MNDATTPVPLWQRRLAPFALVLTQPGVRPVRPVGRRHRPRMGGAHDHPGPHRHGAKGWWRVAEHFAASGAFRREAIEPQTRRLIEAEACPRFARHLGRHFEQWFTFLFELVVEATNWLAEQAIRPAVVNRMVWGGNRTADGARAQGVLMSVIETVRRASRSVLGCISESLRAFGNPAIPAPVLLTGR